MNKHRKISFWPRATAVLAVTASLLANTSDTSFDSGCGKAKVGAFEGRCGYGPRLPFLILSPYAKPNFVDHTTIDQSSILRFIEDNWDLGGIGGQSFDSKAGLLDNMFDFKKPHFGRLVLDAETGQPVDADAE
jgi:phospholipase C